MLDKKRILTKLDELGSYSAELKAIMPPNYKGYTASVEKKRACERLLHISIECVIDTCNLIATDLRLGVPGSEEDLFRKLKTARIISNSMELKLKKMKAFRNILMHRYGTVDDELVYKILKSNLKDFQKFKNEVLKMIDKTKRKKAQ